MRIKYILRWLVIAVVAFVAFSYITDVVNDWRKAQVIGATTLPCHALSPYWRPHGEDAVSPGGSGLCPHLDATVLALFRLHPPARRFV
jgi:hypothetical protein